MRQLERPKSSPSRARIMPVLASYCESASGAPAALITADLARGVIRRRRSSRLIPRFGARPIGRIDRLEVQAWVDELVDELAPATVHKIFRLFARVFDESVEDQLISSSPCRRIKLPPIERHERFTLEPEHVQGLAGAVPDRYRALVLTAAASGLRWGELVGLKVGRLDMLRREIDVAETLVEMSNGQFTFGPPKTKKSRSPVSFPAALSAVLAHHLEQYVPRTARGALDRDGLVFSPSNGGYLRRSNFRRNVWQPALATVGLPADVHFHDVRHFTASLLIDGGASPLEVSEKLRHARPSVTLDVYSHRFRGADERTDAILGDALFGDSWGTGGVQTKR
jgi:integrase